MLYGPICHSHGITGFGNANAEVMFIGIAPGPTEIVAKKPLVGPSGQILNAILKGINYPREQVYCTNLVCWYENSPTEKEIAGCFPRLLTEIGLIKPKLIVALGRIVESVICNFGQERGEVRWHPDLETYVMGTVHPAAIVRGNTFLIHDLIRDITKIKYLTKLKPDGKESEVKFTVLVSKEQAQSVLDCLPTNKPIAMDIETDNPSYEAADYIEDKLLSIALSDGEFTYVIPADFAQGLRWPALHYTFHNGMFDAQGIYRYLGTRLPIYEDTMLMSYTLDERSGHHGLKVLAKEYCASGNYEPTTKVKRKNNFSQIPKDELYEYNAKDAAYTARLSTIFPIMQREDNVEDVYRDLLIPAANAFVPVLHRGVYVDKRRIKELFLEWAPQLVEQEKQLLEVAAGYGAPNINLNSPAQLSKLLFDKMGIPGGPSTEAKLLEPLRNGYPFIDNMLKYRRLEHLITNYLIGMQERIKRDGRLHPSVLLHGTVTGRLSYRDPALQTIPKADKLGEDFGRIRQIFSATNDDYVLVEADYRQAELWYAYYHSHDPVLLEALQIDVHRATAATVNKVAMQDVTPLMRAKAKITNFGIIYGATPPTLKAQYKDFTMDEATEYYNAFFAKYHIYADWFARTKEITTIKGELQSLTGRKRRFRIVTGPDFHRILNQAVNFPIQAAASDTTLKSFIELQPELEKLNSHVLLLVHDSILCEVHKSHLSEAIELIKATMTKTHIKGCGPVPVEIKVGPNWCDMEEVS